jgi:hypothetical protein
VTGCRNCNDLSTPASPADYYLPKELLALPAGNGRAIRGVRPRYPGATTSAKPYVPKEVLHVRISDTVLEFLNEHEFPEALLENPADKRSRASNEAQGAANWAAQVGKDWS